MKFLGWGSRIRTWPHGSRVRCPTARLIPRTNKAGSQTDSCNSQLRSDIVMDMRTLVNGFLLSCKVEGKSLRTVAFYGEKLNKFLWYVEEYDLPAAPEEITTEHIKRFLAYLRDNERRYNSDHPPANKPISATTIKRFYAVLRVMFN